jgi:uncharacterized membrane protein YoaK (UPF0700 family)
MSESVESTSGTFSSYPHTRASYEEMLRRRLPPLLSVIAGMVDVIGYLTLKLFTAHVTGNIVVIAAQLVYGGSPPKLDQILSVPVFVLAVAGVWFGAQVLNKSGLDLSRPLLLIQLLLLACVLIVAVHYRASVAPNGLVADVTAMIAISAMACQFSLLQLAMPGAPSTAVMTGNLTKAVLAFLETASDRQPLMPDSGAQLKGAIRQVLGFFVGCLLGAEAVIWLGDGAWFLPVTMAAIALAVTPRRATT